MTDQSQLKGCPKCGHPEIEHHTWTAFHYGSQGGYKPKDEQFRCLKCGIEFHVRGDSFTKQQAFEIWNTRITACQNQILARMALYLDHFVYHAAQGKVPTLTEENLTELQGLKDGHLPATLWMTGRSKEESWDFQGIFTDRDKAVAACRDETYFVAPATLNLSLPHETELMPECEFPLAGVEP